MKEFIVSFYAENIENLDKKWYKKCFFNNQLEIEQRLKLYNSSKKFWEFVERQYRNTTNSDK